MGEGASVGADDLIELGAVRGAYGVKGWVRIAPFAADGGVLDAVRDWWIVAGNSEGNSEGTSAGNSAATAGGIGKRLVTIEASRRHGASILAKWPGCESKEDADALKGARVAVERGRFPPLPEGEHYLSDVLGSRVVNRAGETLGEVRGLRANEAAGVLRQWLEVADGSAAHLIPLVEPYVDEVDPTGKVIRVDWQRDW